MAPPRPAHAPHGPPMGRRVWLSADVLARNIRRLALNEPGGTVVAVVGMLHVNGCAALLRDTRIV